MKRNDLVKIATVALGTAMLTVAAFWAGPIEAGAEADAPPARIDKTRLVANGIEMTLATTHGAVFQAGDQPAFELTAVNTKDQPAGASICVSMTGTAPMSPMSRTIAMPTVLWEQQQMVSLRPKETKSFTLHAATNLPPNKMFTVSLREQGQDGKASLPGVMALSFSTVVSNSALTAVFSPIPSPLSLVTLDPPKPIRE